MNNEVRDGWGTLIGYRCSVCDGVFPKMRGTGEEQEKIGRSREREMNGTSKSYKRDIRKHKRT